MALLHQSPTRYLPGGYTFRGATLNDAASVIYLLNRRLPQSGLRTEDLRHEWQATRFNPGMDVRMVFDPREYLVGYIQVWMTENNPVLWGCVHPDYEGRGIGTALLSWGEARVRLAMEIQPLSLWSVARFSTLPVQRAHELCESLGWQQAPSVEIASHLSELVRLNGNIYEKHIRQLN